ncbi:MAG: hypothetical protein M1829_005548 [Trizodia sp. TS-e1964]|nr:MAG: hypothetical protein M1829_005548 [Trizodia sp. TS-e1964]
MPNPLDQTLFAQTPIVPREGRERDQQRRRREEEEEEETQEIELGLLHSEAEDYAQGPTSLNISESFDQQSSAPLLPLHTLDTDSGSPSRHSMRPKNRISTPNRTSSISTERGENGHAGGNMNSHMEFRRKRQSLDGPTAVAHLMARESFSLDNEPPSLALDGSSRTQHGIWDLSIKDRQNFILLVLLYFLQGIPMGLATGSVPFLLKPHLSYGQIGIFSLASYPYSLKLLWSPIVDAIWSPKVGRRKSWIMPIQVLSGIGMIWLGTQVEAMMTTVKADGASVIWQFTWWWFFLVFLCATQDIAVDGWALTLLSQENISFASTAQTVGLTAGQFLSYTVFLAFSAPDFANRWFRTVPSTDGVMTLGGYLTFWGWVYLVATLGLAIFKREEKTFDKEGIAEVYKVMWGILKLRNIQTIIIIHLIAKIGFQANDGVTNLKLLDKGFPQEDLALTVLIDFPFEIALGYYVGKWSSYFSPLKLWCWAFIGRLVAALVAQGTVMIFPSDISHGIPYWYLFVVVGENILSTFMNTTMFVAISAFHAKIADPVIGGTYMTLLATVSNLGGTFPKFFVLKLVDTFTAATCFPPSTAPAAQDLKSELVTASFSCALEAERLRCKGGGGTCRVERDGYYITNIICVIIGVATFWSFIRPAMLKLQGLPLRAWRLAGASAP